MSTITMQARVEALLAANVSKKTIATHCGCDESTIYRIRTGAIKDPRFSIGEGIIKLYDQLETPKTGTDD